ncbi:ependymin-like 1 [Parambassis ranga]|uniref:Ependymin-like 1 n=1 Tax=Parambassis ranga TaxID=210632 RepID=A0A6P7K817_9TELE|nr:uncharacterized protein LOC114451185 [Parambassis ranga]
MRVLVALTCLLAACLAKKPHPCYSPPLLTGALTVSTQNEKLWTFARYLYDALGQRVRLMELGTYENKSFTYDVLLLYREAAMYEINSTNRTCKKSPLKADFQPLAIPKDAALLGQVVVGSSSGPGEGLLVNTWGGDLPNKGGKYMSTVTEFGCIPVSTVTHTDQFGWVVTSFFNNVIGIDDPGQLNPPDFCPNKDTMDSDVEPKDFLSLFLNKRSDLCDIALYLLQRQTSNMRALVQLVCLSVGCLAQGPQQCTSPPLLTGSLSISTQSEKLMAFAKYSYDALRQRIRLREFGSYNNKSFHLDVLLLYRLGVMYKINYRTRTCCKKPLNVDFHPLAIPQNASLLGQAVLGSSSGPGQGVLVNTWEGELNTRRGTAKYVSTVTEFGCVPVSTLFHTNRSGWVVTSFFNNVLGLEDPGQLIPPSFCKTVQLKEEDGEEPDTFFSLFKNTLL